MIWIWVAIIVVLVGRLAWRFVFFSMKKKQYARYADDMRFLQVKMPRNDSDMDKGNDAIQ